MGFFGSHGFKRESTESWNPGILWNLVESNGILWNLPESNGIHGIRRNLTESWSLQYKSPWMYTIAGKSIKIRKQLMEQSNNTSLSPSPY
jgi:hypothetical protein